jgi:cytochrome c553
MRVKLYGIGLLALVWAIGTQAALESPTATAVNIPTKIVGDPVAGKEKSQVCIACHGTDGNGAVPAWPKIAGQIEKYLVKELLEYRKADKGTRFESTMAAITQPLTDQDIADLAAFFSQQKGAPGATQQTQLELGQKIYRGGDLQKGLPACTACHGPQGQGNEPAKYPRLSGQHADYTIDQLKKFRAGTRSGDPNAIMRDIVNKMTDKEIQAVSSYVSGLH